MSVNKKNNDKTDETLVAVTCRVIKWGVNSQMHSTAAIFTTQSGGSHSSKNASTAYLAKLKHIMATCDGLSISVDIQENRNAGIGPKASIK